MTDSNIIIFDGSCKFCNSSVNFILKRDHRNVFVFTPLQSKFAQTLMSEFGVTDTGLDTFILIKNNTCFFRTNAALEITKDLSGHWYFFRIFGLLPDFIRDYFYRQFARNRYRLFGKTDTCMIPTPELKDRFLE